MVIVDAQYLSVSGHSNVKMANFRYKNSSCFNKVIVSHC